MKNNNSSNLIGQLLIGLILTLLAAIFIVHFDSLFYGFIPEIKTEEFGQFGDFYSGIVGTLITAFAGIFVYLTFKTQQQQLQLQKKEANQKHVDSLYDRISNEMDGIEVSIWESKDINDSTLQLTTLKGTSGLNHFNVNYVGGGNTVLNQLNLILISFEHLFSLTKDSNYKWDRQLQMNQDRNYLLFYTKLIWPLRNFYADGWDKLINNPNPHPDLLGTRTRFEILLKESYKYLLKRELVGKTNDIAFVKILSKIELG